MSKEKSGLRKGAACPRGLLQLTNSRQLFDIWLNWGWCWGAWDETARAAVSQTCCGWTAHLGKLSWPGRTLSARHQTTPLSLAQPGTPLPL